MSASRESAARPACRGPDLKPRLRRAREENEMRNLEELRKYKPDKLVRRRREKYLRMGQYAE